MFSKNTFVLALCLSVMAAVVSGGEETAPPSRAYWPPSPCAHWLCYPEPFPRGEGKPRYFRKTVSVRGGLSAAKLYCVIDDEGAVFVNGAAVPSTRLFQTGKPCGYEVRGMLCEGRNALAFSVTNLASSGGFICRLELVYADGGIEDVVSDASWKADLNGAAGWHTVGFDDSSWVPPQRIGDANVSPWNTLYDMTPLLTRTEQKATAEAHTRIREHFAEIKARLAGEPKPRCEVRYAGGKAQIAVGTRLYEPIMYMGDHSWAFESPLFREKIEAFRRGGTHLYGIGVNMTQIWKPDGSLDLEAVDNVLLKALTLDPEGYFLFCFYTSGSLAWWTDSHPDELIDYANGGVDLTASDALQRLKAPSFASKVWRRDIGDAIGRVVGHLEQSPLSTRIFGYRPDYGVYAEWHYFGMEDGMPDTGKAMTAAFRQWLRRNYREDGAALRKAWNSDAVTFDNARVPNKEERLDDKAFSLRDPAANRKTADFLRCLSGEIRDCLLHYNRSAKEACGYRALVGNYCGYFFGMSYPAEGWHLENEAILDSPDVDFQTSPFGYWEHFRALGEPQQARSLAETYRLRGKLCILEADTRTYLSDQDHRHVTTAADSVAILTRDFCQALALGCGLWYYDFGKPWYNDPSILEFFGKLQGIRQLPADCGSAAEVVVVGDFESVIYHGIEQNPARVMHTALNEVVRELGHTGVPFDTISFGDLRRGNLAEYKVYIFPNLYYVTPEKLAVVNKLKRDGKIMVWLFAPGYLTGQGVSLGNMAELTGMRIDALQAAAVPETKLTGNGLDMCPLARTALGPLFTVDDPEATVLGTWRHRGVTLNTFAHKKGNGYGSYFCSTAFVSRQAFRDIFAAGKIHVYSDDNDSVVYANRSFVAFHTRKGGSRVLKLPHSATVQRLLPDKRDIGDNVREIHFDAPPNSTTLFFCRY